MKLFMRAILWMFSCVIIEGNLFYNWNPPTRNTLVAVCKTDIDDQNKIDDQFDVDENDPDVDPQQHNATCRRALPGAWRWTPT